MPGNMADASRLVQGLFTLGTTGQMTDGQLLDRFLARRDEGAEAAFEELLTRHGPMVLRLPWRLHDRHDAEDAFQAAFLVLAHQAGSIRRRHSLASWLFGVAQRVAAHAKLRAARVHALIEWRRQGTQRATSPPTIRISSRSSTRKLPGFPITSGHRSPFATLKVWTTRKPLSAWDFRREPSGAGWHGRAAMRRGLVRRGAAVSTTLMLAGEGSQAQPAVPASLVRSTLGIAAGFITGDTAATLARGVTRAMFLRRLRAARGPPDPGLRRQLLGPTPSGCGTAEEGANDLHLEGRSRSDAGGEAGASKGQGDLSPDRLGSR